MFVGKTGKEVRKTASQVHCKEDVATQQTYRRYFASCHADIFRDNRLEAKTWVETMGRFRESKAKRAKLK